MGKKTYIIVGLLFLLASIVVGILLMGQKISFRLGAQDPNKPENVQVSAITEQSATITWTTKNPVQGLISYGLSSTNLTLIQPENSPAVNHQVSLSRLLPGSAYFFVIKVENKIFDNNGQPYTFNTGAKENTPTPTEPIKPLSLTEEGLQAAMGTDNQTYDLNRDGIVNTLDLLILRQEQPK